VATAAASIRPAVSNHGQRFSLTLRPYRFVGTQVNQQQVSLMTVPSRLG
jgi:hypothetical protein